MIENPIIDWEISKKLAGNNLDHAKEFLNLLAQDLSKQLFDIRLHVQNKNYIEIQKTLHKLLGALSYCGATRLKAATLDFYNASKSNADISVEWLCFEREADLLITYVRNNL